MTITRYLILFLIVLVTSGASYAQYSAQVLSIIPAPLKSSVQNGSFLLKKSTIIEYDARAVKAVANLRLFLSENYQVDLPAPPPKKSGPLKGNRIVLTTTNTENVHPDGYELTISKQEIQIKGTEVGLFYGVQTLIQLMLDHPALPARLPCAQISDQPRFSYRGFMLDVSRHFAPVDEVKQLLRLMAQYKMNKFHWHLTDNQGWRIEIKKYPKLTSIGATGNHSDPNHPPKFYTQQDIREVIQYAADLHITVIPEIEMPAHSRAVLNAYPELRCEKPSGDQPLPDNAPYYSIFCPTEKTFTFLEDVLTEVMALFPGKYIHIGGDEANKIPWKQSEFAQSLISRLDLKDEHGLQSYFIQRIEKFVNARGKVIIGWDEILEGGLAPNAVVMSWQGEQGGIAAARQKHAVIMTPRTSGLYFDFPQSAAPEERFISLLSTLKDVHDYDPVPKVLNKEEKSYIFGVQANLWTERLASTDARTYMIYPRLFALAETGWTSQQHKNYQRFTLALSKQLAFLDKKGINYRVPAASADTTLITNGINYELKRPFRDAKIYYTLNTEIPGESSKVYSGPIRIAPAPGSKITLKSIVITSSGRRSLVSTVVFRNDLKKPAVRTTSINSKNSNKNE